MFATALVGTWRSAVLACLIGITLAASEVVTQDDFAPRGRSAVGSRTADKKVLIRHRLADLINTRKQQRQSSEPEPSTVNEKTIADFTRVVEQNGIPGARFPRSRHAPAGGVKAAKSARTPYVPWHHGATSSGLPGRTFGATFSGCLGRSRTLYFTTSPCRWPICGVMAETMCLSFAAIQTVFTTPRWTSAAYPTR
jgi:hypothetical protein